MAVIPSLGGYQIRETLQRYAAEVEPPNAIVEVGCWLGAATAQIVKTARPGVPIHVYDRFRANRREIRYAAKQGVRLSLSERTLPRVIESVTAAGGEGVHFHVGNIREASWSGEPIGLYVDDASKLDRVWAHSVETWITHVVPGGHLILMDYHFEFRSGKPLAQKRYMECMKERFDMVEDHVAGTTVAVFRKR